MGSYSSNYLRLLSYTKQLAAHVNHGRHEKALALFHHIHSNLFHSLDAFIFPLALKSCTFLRLPHVGASLHSFTLKSGFFSNPFVACALIDMYGKCVSIPIAHQLFDEIPHRNVVVWNSMISLYTHSDDIVSALGLFNTIDVLPNTSTFNTIIAGFLKDDGDGFSKAIMFYRKMQNLSLNPNLITILALLRACLSVSALDLIKEIHGFSVRNGIDSHPHFRSGLVEAYGRCGCLKLARFAFETMAERDVVAWSSLISAYALHGEARTAIKMFTEMEMANVKPDGVAFLGVLKACSHAGLADEARMYFSLMENRYGLETSSEHYACLVDALSRAGRLHEAYEVLKGMPVKATAKAWGALLAACRTYGEVELGEIAGRALFELEPENPANYVILSRIYSSTGRHEEAERLREEMKERGVKAAPGCSWVMHQEE